jgi:predicted extracellular nuclease
MNPFLSTPSRALFPPRRALLSPALALALLALASACGQEGTPLFSTSGDEAGGTPSSSGSGSAGGQASSSGSGGAGGAASSSSSGSGSTTSSASSSATSSSTSSGSSSSSGGGGTPVGQPLTVVDWNAHDFFDTLGTIGNDALSAADYQLKRQAIGAAIKAMNPDVIVLQEIENKTVLDDLNQVELGGVYTARWLFNTGDIRELALLSKITPDDVISHEGDIFPGPGGLNYDYTRDCLEVHLTVNGHKVVLLGVHFKSKAPPDNPDRRLAEAQHTRAIADAITAQDPTTAIVVLGDYNDFPASPPYLAVQGAAPNLFFDVAESAPAAERYSFIFQGVKQLIDHQMANPVMTMALDPSSVTLKHGPVFDTNKYASDHSPIMATYRFKDLGAISSPP